MFDAAKGVLDIIIKLLVITLLCVSLYASWQGLLIVKAAKNLVENPGALAAAVANTAGDQTSQVGTVQLSINTIKDPAFRAAYLEAMQAYQNKDEQSLREKLTSFHQLLNANGKPDTAVRVQKMIDSLSKNDEQGIQNGFAAVLNDLR